MDTKGERFFEVVFHLVATVFFFCMTWTFLDMLTADTGSARDSMFLSLLLIILTGFAVTATLLFGYALFLCISREIQRLRDKVVTWRSIR